MRCFKSNARPSWWCMSVNLAFRKLGQKDLLKLEAAQAGLLVPVSKIKFKNKKNSEVPKEQMNEKKKQGHFIKNTKRHVKNKKTS